jgi:hypothetical protein
MKFSPSIYVKTATIMSLFAVVSSFFLSGLELAAGVFLSSLLLSLNLWGWIWILEQTIVVIKDGGPDAVLTFFSAIKFIVLITSLLAIMLFFGAITVAISNSIVVFSLLMPTSYFEYQRRGVSNGW